VTFLHDCHVRAEICIVNLVETEAFKRGNHFSGNARTHGHGKFFAKRGAYRRRGLHYHMQIGVFNCRPHLVDVLFFVKRGGWANVYALTAVKARRFVKPFVEKRGNFCGNSAVGEIQNCRALAFFANGNTTPAKNALALVANNGRRSFINYSEIVFARERYFANSHFFRNGLQFAISVRRAC
jgi:hypothetical protein